jgi:hypothetical protein
VEISTVYDYLKLDIRLAASTDVAQDATLFATVHIDWQFVVKEDQGFRMP